MEHQQQPELKQMELLDLPCDQCLCFGCSLVVHIWERKKIIIKEFRSHYPQIKSFEYCGDYILFGVIDKNNQKLLYCYRPKAVVK